MLECLILIRSLRFQCFQSFKRVVLYLMHTAGLLITKIGMEEYDKVSERALFHLSQLISRDDCLITSKNLVQISSLFLYAVHTSSLLSKCDVFEKAVCFNKRSSRSGAHVSVF